MFSSYTTKAQFKPMVTSRITLPWGNTPLYERETWNTSIGYL